ALVPANHRVNVIAHPLEQLFPRRAGSAKTATEIATKSARAQSICRRRVCGAGGSLISGVFGRHIGSLKHPSRRLAVPNKCMSDEIHIVAYAKIHISVSRSEIITVGAFTGMDQRPFQVVLRGNLVKLGLH